jgi:RNA polymerase sigma-70 factor (ECF subfamily)
MTPKPADSDDELVLRIASRDQQALSDLYDRHRSLLYALSLRILRERAEAEEVLEDVFLQVWTGAGGYDSKRGSVQGWMITLCRSRAIDRLRARGRRTAGAAALSQERGGRAETAVAADDPAEQVAVKERRRLIAVALTELAEQNREAVELAYYGGLSHAEIAVKLGQPLGTVKTRIRQGLISLRESLARQFAGGER